MFLLARRVVLAYARDPFRQRHMMIPVVALLSFEVAALEIESYESEIHFGSSLDDVAAVGADDLPDHERSVVGGEEQCSRRDLARLAEASDRRHRDDRLLQIGLDRLGHRGPDESGRDRISQDAVS